MGPTLLSNHETWQWGSKELKKRTLSLLTGDLLSFPGRPPLKQAVAKTKNKLCQIHCTEKTQSYNEVK